MPPQANSNLDVGQTYSRRSESTTFDYFHIGTARGIVDLRIRPILHSLNARSRLRNDNAIGASARLAIVTLACDGG